MSTSEKSVACPKCNRGVPREDKHCPHCDFSIAIWRSAVKQM